MLSNPDTAIWSRSSNTHYIRFVVSKLEAYVWMGDEWKDEMKFTLYDMPKLWTSRVEAEKALQNEAIPHLKQWHPEYEDLIRE